MLPLLSSVRNEGRETRCFWSRRCTKRTEGRYPLQAFVQGHHKVLWFWMPPNQMSCSMLSAEVPCLTQQTVPKWGASALVPISPQISLFLGVCQKMLTQENRAILHLSGTLQKSSPAAARKCKKTLFSSLLQAWRSCADNKVIYLRTRFIIFVKLRSLNTWRQFPKHLHFYNVKPRWDERAKPSQLSENLALLGFASLP